MIEMASLQTTREFDGAAYRLNSVHYNEEDAKTQTAWLKDVGSEAKIVKDAVYWLVYSKVGG